MIELRTGTRWQCVRKGDPAYGTRHTITSVTVPPKKGPGLSPTEITTWSDPLPAPAQHDGIAGYAWMGELPDFLQSFRPL